MTIFDRIAEINGRSQKLEDKLKCIEIEMGSPRISVYSDMPKGGGSGAGNPLEQYIIRKEELVEKYNRMQKKMGALWAKAVGEMDEAGVDAQTQKMMYLRFVGGMQWKKCAVRLAREFPDCKWNTNKCFRKYSEVLYKLRRHHASVGKNKFGENDEKQIKTL